MTGLITASGGAWNASIVAEYFHFGGQTFATMGLGSTISSATDAVDIVLLIAATVAMVGAGLQSSVCAGGGATVEVQVGGVGGGLLPSLVAQITLRGVGLHQRATLRNYRC